MRLALILFVSAQCWAATKVVCSTLDTLPDGTACTDTDAKTAIEAAVPGDTVILRAGDTFNVNSSTGITLPANNGSGLIVVKSSRANELKPGYRVNQADVDAGRLATLAFKDQFSSGGNPLQTAPERKASVVVDAGTDTFTLSSHGFADRQKIAVTTARRSPLWCVSDGVPSGSAYNGTDGGNPCTGKADYVYDRFGTALAWTDGQPVYVYANTLPATTTITITQGMLLYVRDVGGAGTGTFKLAATAGGTALDITTSPKAFYLEAPPYPLRHNGAYYVCDGTSSTFKLALTKPTTDCASAGGAIDITHAGMGTVSAAKVERAQNYLFKGLEMKPQAGAFIYYLANFGADALNVESIPRNITMEHVYFHGNRNESTPLHAIGFDVINGVIRDSWCDDVKDNVDTQCVLQVNTPGPTLIDNTLLSATGENYISGGAHPNIMGMITDNVRFLRSYFPKRLEWWFGAIYSEGGMGADEFRMVSRYDGTSPGSGTPCNTAFPKNPSHQCFGYTRSGQRVVMENDEVWAGLSGSGTIAIGLTDAGAWIARYTSGVTITTCAPDFTCTQEVGSTINWPADATKWFNVAVVSGAPALNDSPGTTGQMLTHWVTKNTLEIKYGTNYLCEGCVHGPHWLSFVAPVNTGGQHQGPTLHPQTASVSTEPAAFWVKVGPTIWRNNVWLDLHTGISMQQSTNLGGRAETNVGDVGFGHVLTNNLFVGNSNHELGRYTTAGQTSSYSRLNTVWRPEADDVVIDHNTVVDAGMWSVYLSTTGAERIHIRNNVIVPVWRVAATPQFPVVNDAGSLAGSYCGITAPGVGMNPGGTFLHNIIMNRHGANTANDDVGTCGTAGIDYPTTTYMVTGTQNLVSSLFTAWAEHTCGTDVESNCVDRNSNTNLRIADADYKAGGVNDATDGRDLGADIDEVEAECGAWGADCIAGIPPFRTRIGRKVARAATSLTLSYRAQSGTCTIQGWDNHQYSGTPDIDTDDSAITVNHLGFKIVPLTSLSGSTRYWIKLKCSGGVDVMDAKTL